MAYAIIDLISNEDICLFKSERELLFINSYYLKINWCVDRVSQIIL